MNWTVVWGFIRGVGLVAGPLLVQQGFLSTSDLLKLAGAFIAIASVIGHIAAVFEHGRLKRELPPDPPDSLTKSHF